MFEINMLNGDDIRTFVDVRQRYEALLQLQQHHWHSFRGTMRYGERSGKQYLLRRIDKSDRSLGVRTEQTDKLLEKFQTEKAVIDSRIAGLKAEIEARAPLMVARGVGRLPSVPARIIRRLDAARWLGEGVVVVGTNALFAYEALAGVRIASDALATEDVDLLRDARRKISLTANGVSERGLVGLLQDVDSSFAAVRQGSFRAINRSGFMVDLIEPLSKSPFQQAISGVSNHEDDLVSVAIEGMSWLVSAPKTEAILLDETGLPLRMVTIDPRVYALHKLWLSEKEDRDPIKRHRDEQQSSIVAQIAQNHLGLSFDADDLSALPASLRELKNRLEMSPTARLQW
ncbi:hypothetical protein G6L28_16680 [Agrobacterium larrymoorei]|uniref:GSU2403 family nucleotidyltransferase fold protein n=1 Tax=Agrobacterium larrymoorei TaxID=160699 RepID=UPI001573D872|nr:nucleotidyltransferase domain-containing protein [Agrobacterium larrymoorei]NTJ44237.1 hypothetical protein [Agrobacterium larrymoorei]